MVPKEHSSSAGKTEKKEKLIMEELGNVPPPGKFFKRSLSFFKILIAHNFSGTSQN